MARVLHLTFHQDPGHGWLEVDRILLSGLNLNISPFSYQKNLKNGDGGKVFLEEDRDMTLFLHALSSKGIEVVLNTKRLNRDHYIRNYESYKP